MFLINLFKLKCNIFSNKDIKIKLEITTFWPMDFVFLKEFKLRNAAIFNVTFEGHSKVSM